MARSGGSGRGGTGAAYRRAESIPDFVDAVRIRVDAFIVEQGCPPGWEPDDLDRDSAHYVGVTGDGIVATGRLRADRPGSLKIERMAVRKDARGSGIGEGLLGFLTREALAQRPERIWMEAQAHLVPFYERAGFAVVSEVYDLFGLGIPHVAMEFTPTGGSRHELGELQEPEGEDHQGRRPLH